MPQGVEELGRRRWGPGGAKSARWEPLPQSATLVHMSDVTR